jgi:large subunit ribosomal protein L6
MFAFRSQGHGASLLQGATRGFSVSAIRPSHIGSAPILIPQEVTVEFTPLDYPITKTKGRSTLKLSQNARISGPKGELNLAVPDFLKFENDASKLKLTVEDETNKTQKSLWGTMRSLINNHVSGVTEGHLAILKFVGTGYRTQIEERDGKPYVWLKLGASIPRGLFVPEGLQVTSPSTTRIIVEGIDKQQVRLFAANIRRFHPPEPYKGKGIYLDSETIKLKDKKIK